MPSPEQALYLDKIPRGVHAFCAVRSSCLGPHSQLLATPLLDPGRAPIATAGVFIWYTWWVNTADSPYWDDFGVPRHRHVPCPVCNDNDEVGSSFDHAWCHRCGWHGSLTDMHMGKATVRHTRGVIRVQVAERETLPLGAIERVDESTIRVNTALPPEELARWRVRLVK